MDTINEGRNNLRQSHNNLRHSRDRAMSATATVEGLLFDFIARTYGSRRHGRKLLAAHAGVSVRAAETYIAGRHLPSVPTAVRLMQHHPDLLHEFMRLFDK